MCFWHWIWLTLDPGDIDIDLNTGWQRPRSIQYGRRHSRLLLASDLISMHTRDLMQLCCWRWINYVLALMFNLMLDWTLFSWETVCSETSGLNPQSHVCINIVYCICWSSYWHISWSSYWCILWSPASSGHYCWLFYASHHIVCGIIDSMHTCDKYRWAVPAGSNLWEEMKSIVLLLPL